MAATVPHERLDLTQGDVQISNPVRSVTWIDAARQHDWLAGRGHMVVPAHAPMVTISAGSTSTFSYRTKPRYQDTRYCYSVVLTGAVATDATVTIDGDARVVTVTAREHARAVSFFSDRSAQSTAEATLSISITADSVDNDDVDVECISIEAVPRTLLAVDASDLGVERLDFWVRGAISQNNISAQIFGRQAALLAASRRTGGFQHSFGDLTPWSMASATWTSVFDGPFLAWGRYLYESDAVAQMTWKVRAYCSDGTTSASVRITNTSNGASLDVITIGTGLTAADFVGRSSGSTPANFDCAAEDPTVADGRRGSANDEHTIEVQRTAGTGTIYIESISIWEA